MNSLAKRILIVLMISLLPVSNGLAGYNQPLNLPSSAQPVINNSLHETTELAEILWAEQSASFVTLYEAGDFTNAFETANRSYNFSKDYFGENSVNTADTLLKLGIVNQSMGNLPSAKKYLVNALAILEKKLSPDDPDIAITLTNLGNVHYDLQDYTASENNHKSSLNIRLHAFGPDDSSVAQSTYNLAVLYERISEYQKAEDHYRKAIGIWTRNYGPLHPYIGRTLSNLANTYIAQSKISDAIRIQQRAVAFKKSTLGIEHKEVAQALIELGILYVGQGQYDIAGGTYKEALNIAENLLNPIDPQLALLMYTLANVYHLQARMEEPGDSFASNEVLSDIIAADSEFQTTLLVRQALPLYERAAEILDIDQEIENQPALHVVLSELAILYKSIGENDKATATETRLNSTQ